MGWLRKIAWGLLWKWFRGRLMEKSTWVGIFALMAAFGLPVNPALQDKLAFLLAESVEGDFLQLEYLQAFVTLLGALLGGTLIVVKEKGKKAGESETDPVAEAAFGEEAGRIDDWAGVQHLSVEKVDANLIEASTFTYDSTIKHPDEPRPLSDKVKNAKPRKGRGGRR